MKRRVISLLAILAMLCTMVVFVAPTTTAAEEDYTKYPAFNTYQAGTDITQWTISSVEDWTKVCQVAGASTEAEYFKGYTFHLTTNINFNHAKIYPVGSAKTGQASGGVFAGTINGHGNSFQNVGINPNDYSFDYDSTGEKKIPSIGLFLRLGDCEFIDFGLEGGLVYDGGTSTVAGAVSSFGRAMPGKTPKFTRVWSSVTVACMKEGTASGLVHTIEENAITVDVNGFVFDGRIIKSENGKYDGQFNFGVTGHTMKALSKDNSFANIITDFASFNAKFTPNINGAHTYTQNEEYNPGVRTALFNFDTVTNFQNANKGNIYAVKRSKEGIDEGYFLNFRSGYGGSGSEELLTDMTAIEAAWAVNSNQPISGKDAVYYTLVEETVNGETIKKVRPIAEGAQTGKIVKVTLDGMRKETYFFNAGQELSLKDDLNKVEVQTFKVGGTSLEDDAYTLGANDITIDVGKVTSHSSHTWKYDWVEGTDTHTRRCTVCNYFNPDRKYDCTPADGSSFTKPDIDYVDLAEGQEATHSVVCKDCGAHEIKCKVEYVINEDKDNVWDFSKCSCGRSNVSHTDVRGMLAGDVNLNGTVDARDAIAVLKKMVKRPVNKFNERNANVDEDNNIEAQDAYTIILRWLGDNKIITKLKTIEAKANTANHYNKTTVGNLKMDGSEGTNDRYVCTRDTDIAVKEGDTIVFGPVRMQQAVMGWFYDADENPLTVINRNDKNLEVEYEFADGDGKLKEADLTDAGRTVHNESLGLVMASIVVPEGAAFVRFNVNAEEKDKYYIRINDEFSIGAYKSITKVDVSTLGNPLKNQFVLNMGDSLADGAGHYPLRDPDPDGRLTCWSRRTMQQFGAKVVTSAQGGSTVSTKQLQDTYAAQMKKGEGLSFSSRSCILNQINEHSNSGRQFEYILLEGGGNDAGGNAPLGYIGDSFDPNSFDTVDTYSGALERLIYTAIQQHGDTAALGYFIPYDMRYPSKAYSTLTGAGTYFDRCKEICAKWGIPVCDLFYISHEDENGNIVFDSRMNTEEATKYFGDKYSEQVLNPDVDTSATGLTYDGCHALDAGHEILFTYIKPFMLEMKPVSAEIYAQVQEYHKNNPLPTVYYGPYPQDS